MQIIHRNPRELHIPLMQIQGLRPYVPSYVYDVACGKERRDMVTEAVAAGSAFCEDGLGCLVLVTVLGVDMLQTQRVGRHLESLLMDDTFMAFSKIMDTVSVYEGDIVYVHADSILICFDAKNDKGSSLSVAGQRAVACCADIVLGFETDSPFFGPHAIDSVESLTSLGCPPTKVKAVASYGPIRHIILGSTMRYEYGICSDLDFEGLNNATDFGEIGITKTLWEAIGLSDPIKSSINPLRQRQLNDKITYETDALLSVVQSLDRLIEHNLVNDLPNWTERGKETDAAGHFCHLFISHGIIWRLNKDDLNSNMSINGSFHTLGDSAVNLSQSGSFEHDTLRICVVRLKVYRGFDPVESNATFSEVNNCLQNAHGTFHQFYFEPGSENYILLFGVPPSPHKSAAISAVQFALEIVDKLSRKHHVKVSLSTGRVHCMKTAGMYRRTSVFTGRPMQVSLMLLNLPTREHAVIFCDDQTFALTHGAFKGHLFGNRRVKDFASLITVWSIECNASSFDYLTDGMGFHAGFHMEKEQIQHAFTKWKSTMQESVILIEGPTGSGKSSLVKWATDAFRKKHVALSSGKGSELHQLTSYYPFQSILIDLLCLDITDNNSLEKRPADSLLRSKSMASNLHRTLSTNLHFSADFGSLGSLTRLSKSSFLASSPVLPFDLSMSDENLHENLGSREKALVRPSKEFSLSDPDLKSSDTMGARHAIATLLNTEGEAGNIPYGITISHGSLAAALGKGKSESCVKRSRLTVNRSTETVAASLENLSANESQQDLGSQSFGISELVVHTLQMLGEPVDLAPLLRDVIPWLPLEETEKTSRISKHARHNLLKYLLINIIHGVSEEVFLALAFDEIQWFDSLSMDLLVSITRSCPNVFFILAVEDQRDKDKVSFLKSITDLSWGVHAKLSPLSFMDTKEILAWKFRDKGIAVINSDATTILTERTGGNPLYINLMSDVIRNSELLQGFFFKTSALGKSEKFDIERHLPKSLEACVVLLYGSLDHRFQYLLKAASIYGDCFALEAIANIIEPRCAVLDLMGWIESFDKFSFLVLQEDDMNSFEKRYSFRHSLIRRVIYESIPVRKRREMHMGILDYFEDVVFGNDVNDKLPVMCYHASRCEDISKHIIHLSRFSELCLSRWMLPECSHALESLINSSNGREAHDPRKLARWWSKLALIQFHLGDAKEAFSSAKKALVFLGLVWPKSRQEFKRAIVSQSVKQMGLWAYSKGGQKEMPKTDTERSETVSGIVRILPEILHADPTSTSDDHHLALLLYANDALQHVSQCPSEFAKACARAAHYFWYAEKKSLAKIYFKRALELLSTVPDSYDAYYLISQVMEAKGMLDQSLKLKSDCISIAESFGDHAFIRKMLVSSTYTMLDLAEFDNVKEKCRLLVSLAFSDDDHLSRALSFSASIFCSIMTDDIEQSRLEARALSEILPKTATTRKSIILGALCIFHARAGEFQAAMKFLSDLANHSENVQTHSLVSMKAISIVSMVPFLLLTEWRSLNRQYLITVIKKLVKVNEQRWGKTCEAAKCADLRYRVALALLDNNLKKAREALNSGYLGRRSKSPSCGVLEVCLTNAVACRYGDLLRVDALLKKAMLGDLQERGMTALLRWGSGEPLQYA